MKAFRIKYQDGRIEEVIAKTSLDVIKTFDLCTKENINTRVIELEGEQKAIVFSNLGMLSRL